MPLSTIQILSSQYELSSQLSPTLGLLGLIETFSRTVIRRYTLKNVHVYLENYTSPLLKDAAYLFEDFSIVSNNSVNLSETFHKRMIEQYISLPEKIVSHKCSFQNMDNFCLILRIGALGFIVLESNGKHIDNMQVRSLISIKKIFGEHILACMEKESLRQSHDKIYKQLYFNELTKLPNRKKLFKDMIEWDEGSIPPMTVILFNIREFRLFNHQHGYPIGDKLLRRIARELENEYGRTMVYHISADEFLAFCKKGNSVNALEDNKNRLKHIKKVIKQKTWSEDKISVDLWSCTNNHSKINQTRLEIFNTLEFAMSLLRSERNALHLPIDDETLEDFSRDHKIHAAMASDLPFDQFHLVFQPQFDITGQIIAAEALVRWHNPDLGLISPDSFIPLLEANQKIASLDQFVLDQSLEAMSALKKLTSPTPKLAINVSGHSFLNDGFYDDLIQKLSGRDDIILELTESAKIFDLQYLVPKFSKLIKKGIEIHLDDFGTGYSSISYLMSLQFGMLKIDKSFISKIDTDEKKQGIVKSIINLAKSCNLEVLVEGVENQNEFKKCVSLGVTKFQGYYFSKPVSFSNFAKMVQTQNEQRSQKTAQQHKLSYA